MLKLNLCRKDSDNILDDETNRLNLINSTNFVDYILINWVLTYTDVYLENFKYNKETNIVQFNTIICR